MREEQSMLGDRNELRMFKKKKTARRHLGLKCRETGKVDWEEGPQRSRVILVCPEAIRFRGRSSVSILFIFFIFKLYNIVLVLPNTEMNPPQVYLCSPS